MPTESSPSTARRLLALLELLQQQRDWPARVLGARLGVSERTVRRDVDRLRELDFAVVSTRGPDGGYRLEAGARLPPLLLDEQQALAVVVALRTTVALGGGLGETAARALTTVDRLLPSRVAHQVARFAVDAAAPAGAVPVEPEVLLAVGAAVRDRQTLRFDHEPVDGPGDDPGDGGREPRRPGARTTEPHHLLLRRGRWYVVGWSPERDDWRVHRLDRMRLRPPHGRRFEPRALPGDDPVAFVESRFRGSSATGWPCKGSAVVAVPAARVAPYLGDGVVEAVDDDRCRVRLGSWSWEALAARLLGLGGEVGLLEPVGLRDAMARLGTRATAASAP